MSEIRVLRHKLTDSRIYYSIGRLYEDGTTDDNLWAPTPEELQRLINEAFEKEPVDFKAERFSG